MNWLEHAHVPSPPSSPLYVYAGGLMGVNIEGPESVASAIVVLAAVIGFHELGHFLAARFLVRPFTREAKRHM